MAQLYIDCTFGLGGDMMLAAMADLGFGVEALEDALHSAGVEVALDAPVVTVNCFAGRRLSVQAQADQPMRHLDAITAIISRMPVSETVRDRSVAAFTRLAEVEAKMHGVSVDAVHFHEVGAVDTLVDIVGAFMGIEALGVDTVQCGPLPWFTGTVECAHGTLPLPSPAALELMLGKPIFPSGLDKEIVTPTGALLLDQLVDAFTQGPEGRLAAVGRSFGTHDLGPGATGLRLVLVEPA